MKLLKNYTLRLGMLAFLFLSINTIFGQNWSYQNRFSKDWHIGIGVGPMVYFGDHNRQESFGARINPNFDLVVGKSINPNVDVRIGFNGFSAKGLTTNGSYGTGDVFESGLEHQKINFLFSRADMVVNFSNIIYGYNPARLYDVSGYAGIGYMFAFNEPKKKAFAGNIGIINTLKISPTVNLNADLRATFVGDHFDGERGGRRGEGLGAILIGATFKLK